ncbi:conserved Plasmodium protein, unknown function [Plasmodium ovale curtisi]|nr:conserved Plasmodium protein, unknown function [Plasmodium ovale curtisi]
MEDKVQTSSFLKLFEIIELSPKMEVRRFIVPLSVCLMLICLYFCNCEKVKKNKGLRNLLKLLTDRVDSDEGENEYARLTQAPIINMNLSKINYKTTLQNVLVEPYSEKVKELISANNFDIRKEKVILDKIKNCNNNLRRIGSILSIKRKNNSKAHDTNLKSTYFHYLNDSEENLGLTFFPVYKTFKSNSSHFNNYITNSLLPHELLEKSSISNKTYLRNVSRKLFFPERGDTTLDI